MNNKIIFYKLVHWNNPNLNQIGYEYTHLCPIEWFENKKREIDRCSLYITYIAYEDKNE